MQCFRTTGVLLILLAAWTSIVGGAEFEQIYSRESDGRVLLRIGLDGRVAEKNSEIPWDEKRTATGVRYYECLYQAKNRLGETVNRQYVWYFPRDPVNGNTDASNYWVYWCNPAKEVTWGRCPTPHHPRHREWVTQKGVDLWQIVPPDRRPTLKGVFNLRQVGEAMNPAIIGSNDAAMPKVAPETGDDTIFCVDFDNTIFI